ncbi:MAG TPA: YceI family protein [Mycobacteriales bacterium]
MSSTIAAELRDGTWTVPATGTTATFAARNFGVLTVRGTLAVETGTLTVAGGRPVTAEGTLTAASVATGNPRRDGHLRSARFLAATEHPALRLRALRFEPADGGWTVPATITVHGVETPITLYAQQLPSSDGVRVRITGELDRTTTAIRAPRLMVGHRIQVEADLTFTRS